MTASMLDLVELLHQNQKSIPCHLNLSNLRTNNARTQLFLAKRHDKKGTLLFRAYH